MNGRNSQITAGKAVAEMYGEWSDWLGSEQAGSANDFLARLRGIVV